MAELFDLELSSYIIKVGFLRIPCISLKCVIMLDAYLLTLKLKSAVLQHYVLNLDQDW